MRGSRRYPPTSPWLTGLWVLGAVALTGVASLVGQVLALV